MLATGLRSALHRLGLPLIPAAPVRIVELRLYLDRDALSRALGDAPGAGQAIAALLDPGGRARPTPGAARLAGAALLHRLRLRRPAARRAPAAAHGASVEELRATLSALLPALSDAVLAELLGALARRRDRAAGRLRPPCLGREAWRFHTGRAARLERLGPPEPLLPSWAKAGAPSPPPPSGAPPPHHRYRGRFREQYREALDRLTPIYRRLAEDASGRGLLDDPADAFFLPLELADELAADRRPEWLGPAVAANRREYMACRGRPSPADRFDPDGDRGDDPAVWELCPLNPLP